jgi:hypothetical protein
MRSIGPLLSLLLVAAGSASAASVHLPFFDASGRTFATDLFSDEPALAQSCLMLVVTKSLESAPFKRQMNAVGALGQRAEELHLLVAVAALDGERRSGYWLTSADAGTLLPDKADFRVMIVAAQGQVSAERKVPVLTQDLARLASRSSAQPCALPRQ